MKNILVATDFSNDAYCALFYITKLMVSRPCSFLLLNVFDELTAASLTMASIRVLHIKDGPNLSSPLIIKIYRFDKKPNK